MSAVKHDRVFIDKQHPAAYRALNGLGLKVREAAEEAGFDRRLVELINVRVSQLNGCAYCLNMHVKDALAAGESQQRLAVLAAWRDTSLFSEQEQAVLALAESITELPPHELADHEYAFARQRLTAEQISAVSWIVLTMNAFNRLSIVSRHPVRPDESDWTPGN
ncbi:alkylhydroperoxidase [Arthrobacter crystallopoietes BAB-32]|uniref:Alkylhydroperoxidase n=1 Tax=Arthrobacter crystallopoietes BAB-32 TaxID=1246476 RepID=N1UYJ1_9MICC|nr:carboxymuconolactone decarboxylase family protein [Arthrobacter crystallopoietes]EMY32897.1 alkylhydroperoxidase [Arthrobacter crystallopoietes BAB-32]